jgi:anti-sigma factor RsiW
MSHQPYLDWIHAALDGELRPDQRLQLEEHVGGCAGCRSLWEALSEVDRLFTAEPPVAPRPGFTGRFNARLSQQRSRPHLVWGALALGLGSVTAAALVVPLGAGLILSAVRVVQQPAASAALLSSLAAVGEVAGTLLEALLTLLRVLAVWAVTNPLMWAASLTALMMTGVWVLVMRKLNWEVSFQ